MVQNISFGRLLNRDFDKNKAYMKQIIKNDTDREASLFAFAEISKISNQHNADVFLDIVDVGKPNKNNANNYIELMIIDDSQHLIASQTFNRKYAVVNGNNKRNFEKLTEGFREAMEREYNNPDDCEGEKHIDINA